MKTYTEVLMNPVPGGHRWYKSDPNLPLMHYEAKHKTENIYILWMETKMMRKRVTLPCALIEEGSALIFKSSSNFATGKENSMLLKRWSLFVSPQNINTDWDVTFLEKEEFLEKYKNLQPTGSKEETLPELLEENTIDTDEDSEI